MKQRPERQWNHAVQLRPASVEEAGLFYSQVEEDRDWQSGTVGHVRMDFGHGGKEFWHTWWPHNQDQFNTPEFKETLQTVVDALRRDGPLKDLSAMRSYCQQHGGGITEDGENFGYIAETEHYQFCLRCTPVPGHYQGYLYCYDKRQQEMVQHDIVVGRVTYADGTRQEFTDSELYSDLKADKEKVTFTLTNTGKQAGAEVAQLYVSRPDSQLFTPLRELKGFAKVFLQPGESRTVTISLDDKAFRYFNVKTNRWEIEGGTYRLEVGASAADILLTAQVEVEGTGAPIPYDREKLSCYYSAQVQAVPDDQFEALLGRPIPQDKWDRSAPLDFNDSLSQMIYAKGFVARFAAGRLAAMQRKSEAKGEPNLNVLFIHNMPFRALAKMSNGMATTEMSHAILDACNGHFFRGVGKAIGGFFANGKAKKERSKKL
ncbi:MAG: fibronectin type III-like domain-contianing protein [Flintibacter sp.]|uniref:fibronectin type III-like domain-contianing protein n=1 Tax=Flintibacter sp. TaxID=1918624 RepID=UPI002672F544|nr:fibronectin type III-like domain-contianing protein [Flintibacter sp.]MCI6150044.1 fibronectin type III-like domain-contianing protein [Flintibacter sp.]MDY5039509.1 fibronectin type III-like domain-contianing protein [Lawsonibacter sp.]